MKNDIDNLFKELVIVGIIFMGICFGLQSLEHNQELKRVHKLVEVERIAKIEAMKLSIELNNANDKYIDMLQSMNDYADDLHLRIETLENQSQIIKDLRSSK